MSTLFFGTDTTPGDRARLRELFTTGSVEERARQVRSALGDKSVSQLGRRLGDDRSRMFIDRELAGEIREQNIESRIKLKTKVGSEAIETSEQRRRVARRKGAQRALLGGGTPLAQRSVFKRRLGDT